MMKPTGRIAALFTWSLCCGIATLGLDMTPVDYQEGFEGDPPRVTCWASNGDATVNALGVTDEAAFEGTRSFKLDVTLESGSYHYWGAPVSIPVEGTLMLSARIRVGAETTVGRVGFGTNMVYPPSTHSGCGPVSTFRGPTEGWELVESDLIERAEAGKDSVVRRHTVNLTGEDVGAVLDRWSLFIYGRPGERAVVYVDAIRISGEVPERTAYEAALRARYEAKKAAFRAQLARWRAALAGAASARSALASAPAFFRSEAEAILRSVSRAETILVESEKVGHASQDEVDSVRYALAALENGPLWLQALAADRAAGRAFVAMSVPEAIANRPASVGLPVTQAPGAALSCAGCRGEVESVAFSVYALEDVAALRVRPTELRGPAGRIPAEAVDTYVLASWYQGAGGIGYSAERVLKPELLLKDPGLIRVDHEAKHNYLRSTDPDGTQTYLLCSGDSSDNLADVRPVDADSLQPVSLAAGTLQDYWVNVTLPEDAAAGAYSGELIVESGASRLSVPLSVTVRPFDLLPSRLTYSIYYRAKLSRDGEPTIGSEYKSADQYRAEIMDMRDHGVLYPTNYQSWEGPYLRRILTMRRELGLPTDAFFNLGQGTGSTADPARLAALKENVLKWRELCAEFGYDTVYFYGIDEAKGDRLAAQRAAWGAVQEAGGKTFVACYKKTFEAMGGLLDCAVLAHVPDPREAEKWHSVGSLAFCYANPQVGVEAPETYRRNFGLVLWKAGFDGAMDYAYQHGFTHVWNDFDNMKYRDHNFTYPTVNGVVGTIQWEGFREAVDDVRYVTTLEQAIAGAGPDRRATAEDARRWLDALEPRDADLYEVRGRMASWIEALR